MRMTNDKIKCFEEKLINEEKSDATLEKYLRDVKAFLNWTGDVEIDKMCVLKYKKYLMSTYAPVSVNSVLSSLNSFFDFEGRQDLKVRMLRIQKQIFANKDRELSKTEYERLLRTAKKEKNQRLCYIMQTICATGIRVSELKFITVEAIKTGKAEISCKGKMRVVILPRQLCKTLIGYTKRNNIKNGSVFVTRTGKAIDRCAIWKMMKGICQKAGVAANKVFPHNLRHLFARTYYKMQKDIVRLADILGHSSVNTTRIYTMETGEIHRNHIQKLGLLMC